MLCRAGDGEDYFAFVRRAASNRLALPVKRADLEDNIWQSRQTGASAAKYEEALRILDDEFFRAPSSTRASARPGVRTNGPRHGVRSFICPHEIVGRASHGMDAPVAGDALQRAFARGVGLFEKVEIDIFERDVEDRLVSFFAQHLGSFRGSDYGVGKSHRHRAGKRLYD
jgi:hypothetical protein